MADAHDEARRIGEVIRRARVLAKRSQANVAATLGYHQSKVSRLEQGKGTEDSQVLRAIALELGIPLPAVGLAAIPDGNTCDPETEDMHRRTFLAASLAALATPAPPTAATATSSNPSCPAHSACGRGSAGPTELGSRVPRSAASSARATTPSWSGPCRR